MAEPAGAEDTDPGICVGCGLCCDGTLYGWVELAPGDDVEIFVALGRRPRTTDAGVQRVEHPCVASVAARCVVYADRPARCRHYRCDLLKAVEDGDTPADRARRVIAEAVEHRDRVRTMARALVSEGPDADPRRYHAAVRAVAGREVEVSDRERAELLLEYGALRTRLGRHFKTSDPWVMGPDAGEAADDG